MSDFKTGDLIEVRMPDTGKWVGGGRVFLAERNGNAYYLSALGVPISTTSENVRPPQTWPFKVGDRIVFDSIPLVYTAMSLDGPKGFFAFWDGSVKQATVDLPLSDAGWEYAESPTAKTHVFDGVTYYEGTRYTDSDDDVWEFTGDGDEMRCVGGPNGYVGTDPLGCVVSNCGPLR